jgi:undecaprenyl-diphosphatase
MARAGGERVEPPQRSLRERAGAAPSTRVTTDTTEHGPRPLPTGPLLLALVLLLGAFGALTALVLVQPVLAPDVAVERAVQRAQAPWLDTLTAAIGWLGFPPGSIVVDALIVLGIALSGRIWGAVCAAIAAAGSAGVWFLVLAVVQRPRPTPDLVRVTAEINYGSFPSGHVLNLTTFYGFVALLAWTSLPPGWPRRLGVGICSLLVAAIGLVRIYSGEHWPTDVLAGYLLGAACWLLVSQIYLIGTRRARPKRTWHSNTN